MKILFIVIVTTVLFSCGNGNGHSTNPDDTTKSISPPPTADTATAIAPMMGDTSKTDADSLKK